MVLSIRFLLCFALGQTVVKIYCWYLLKRCNRSYCWKGMDMYFCIWPNCICIYRSFPFRAWSPVHMMPKTYLNPFAPGCDSYTLRTHCQKQWASCRRQRCFSTRVYLFVVTKQGIVSRVIWNNPHFYLCCSLFCVIGKSTDRMLPNLQEAQEVNDFTLHNVIRLHAIK